MLWSRCGEIFIFNIGSPQEALLGPRNPTLIHRMSDGLDRCIHTCGVAFSMQQRILFRGNSEGEVYEWYVPLSTPQIPTNAVIPSSVTATISESSSSSASISSTLSLPPPSPIRMQTLPATNSSPDNDKPHYLRLSTSSAGVNLEQKNLQTPAMNLARRPSFFMLELPKLKSLDPIHSTIFYLYLFINSFIYFSPIN